VVISDFPDPALVNNIAKNIDLNIASLDSDEVATAVAKVSLLHSTSRRRPLTLDMHDTRGSLGVHLQIRCLRL
jgi:hypothetical protein